MTVHVHRDVSGINVAGHSHSRPEQIPEGERTWSFDCRPECEARVTKDVELAARHAAGVPLVAAEKDEEERADRTARRDVADLAMALKDLARERVTQAQAAV